MASDVKALKRPCQGKIRAILKYIMLNYLKYIFAGNNDIMVATPGRFGAHLRETPGFAKECEYVKVCVYVCVLAYVCVCEREIKRKREREKI